MNYVLQIQGYSLGIPVEGRMISAVTQLDLEVGKGEAVALVGESGCGKSLTALSIAGLAPAGSKPLEGRILLEGEDVLSYSPRQWMKARGTKVSMIFQEPLTALDPLVRVGRQIEEASVCHGIKRKEASILAHEMMEKVGFVDIDRLYRCYPHQLSGGMRQRIMICIALMGHPSLLVADEPTTALDSRIQRQVIETMKGIYSLSDTSLLFISHDLMLVSTVCSRVYVMYAGRIVETGSSSAVLQAPAHPYTQDLLASLPSVDKRGASLPSIQGTVPSLEGRIAEGCPFAPRCKRALPICSRQLPPLVCRDDQKALCHLLREEDGWSRC
ncbi:MAG: ABC transporter ATP-binding protein [Spirochaetia bacterium]|jgi:peptide/nickel transport system ATP-binding protein|nr:ABC transporter ATP-binding protein [Spirochaetia bacterium]